MLKKRNLLFLSLLILGILLLSSCFLNPPATEGLLKGQIMVPEGFTQAKELTGQALPDATVNIIDLATGAIIATTVTDSDGYYQVSVPPGGPYLLEAVKGGVKLEQITCPVEVGIEYDLGTADCVTTAAALIAQAMMDAGDNPADINCADIIADPNFDDVSSIVCSTIQAGQDPTVSAVIEEAVEDFLNPPTPTPTPNPNPTPLSTDATISAGTLAAEALAGTFTGAPNIGDSSALTVTVPDASKTDAALVLTKGNANSTIKYVKSASPPANDTDYTETYTSGATQITVADGDVIWLLVTAEDGTSKLYYKITVTVSAPLSTDATLKASSTVKGKTLLGLGTPNAVIASATGGTVNITGPEAADTTNLTPFITLFDPTDAGATTKVVKYAKGASTDNFATDTAYNNEIIMELDFFIVEVTAEDTTTILYYKVVVTVTLLAVGDSYGGGKIAYILQPGESNGVYSYNANVQHGLIAATADQSPGIQWYNGSYVVTGATGTAIGTGQSNTTDIVIIQGAGSYAAQLCYVLTLGGYNDWFLPSKGELNKLYINKVAIGGFADWYYWSSSEVSAYAAWSQLFTSGSGAQTYGSKYDTYRVRAVRAF